MWSVAYSPRGLNADGLRSGTLWLGSVGGWWWWWRWRDEECKCLRSKCYCAQLVRWWVWRQHLPTPYPRSLSKLPRTISSELMSSDGRQPSPAQPSLDTSCSINPAKQIFTPLANRTGIQEAAARLPGAYIISVLQLFSLTGHYLKLDNLSKMYYVIDVLMYVKYCKYLM